jgi:lipopolysaccharide biosynthesis glycosyltransferase
MDMEYVMKHTAILHFCGKKKPWRPNYNGNFSSIYRHYQHLAQREKVPV